MPGPAKILVADDSNAERKTAREALTAAGYEVVEAVDGQQALELYARERPQLVMLDVVMPRLTGLETCRILKAKAHGQYLPVIMVSSRNSVNARVEGLRSGADDYLGKPYDAEELRARVEALLRTQRALADAPPDQSRTAMLVRSLDDAAETTAAGDDAFARRLDEEFDRAERYSDPLACVRVQIDDDDVLAEQFGAASIEAISDGLREVIELSVRKIDLVFRLGPGTFTVLLPNTHFPGALAVAERIAIDARRKLAVDPDPDRIVTVSAGVSFYPNKDTHTAQDLLSLVEAALERARGEGGGKICLYQHQGYLYAPEA